MTDKVDIAALRELIPENPSGGLANVTVWSDELTALLDELAALREATTPRPIETAPRDGTLVFAYSINDQCWVMPIFDCMSDEPSKNYSHWLPMPPAPKDPS